MGKEFSADKFIKTGALSTDLLTGDGNTISNNTLVHLTGNENILNTKTFENVTITGVLSITGTQNIYDTTNLSITDSLIFLSNSQFDADVLDIGIYGAYGDIGVGHSHTGLVRDASDKIWKLISSAPEPLVDIVDFTNVVYDTLKLGAIQVSSTTLVSNLNADYLDGQHGSYYYPASNPSGFTSNLGTVTSVASGNGMNFTTITGAGTVTLGTPSDITLNSTNSTTATSHTHDLNLGGTVSQYLSGAGTLITFPTIPTVGTWGALNYPTWTSNTPFVKMTGIGTFSLDNTTYLSSAITSLGGLTGSTQTFGNDTNVTMVSTGTAHTLTWSGTLADGRIASASTWNAKQNALSGTGFVKSTAGVISYDTSTYITGNQSITLSGAVTGTGTTAITTTLANSIVGITNLTATGTPSATTYLRGDNTWATVAGGGGGSAGGTVGEVQYNDGAGGFAGAANVEISNGNLRLVATTDPATPVGGLIHYAKSIAGRVLPKIIGTSGIDTVMQVGLHGNSVFLVAPANATTAPTVIGGVITTATTISHQQTIASANPWQATRRTRFQTSTTAGNATGARTAYTQWFRGNVAGFGGFWFRCQLGMNINLQGGQKFVGLCNSTGALAGDPSALLNMCGMGYDAADLATGNWFFMYNDGTGTATKVDLGVNAVRSTTAGYDLVMYIAPNGSELFVRIVNIATNVTVLETSYTTLLPVVNTGMAFKAEVRNGAVASADNIEIAKVYIETDY